jgi:hypothetical protein
MSSEILVRGIPPNVREWIVKESYDNRISQNEFVINLFRRAFSGGAPDQKQLGLFPSGFSKSSRNDSPNCGVPFSFVDLFAGIGGLRMGLENVGGTCQFSCEWDRYSQRTYKSWFGEVPSGYLGRAHGF